MTSPGFFKRLFLGATLVAVGALLAFAMLAATTPNERPLENSARSAGEAGGQTAQSLECPPGDLIFTAESYLAHTPRAAERATPAEALRAAFTGPYPELQVNELGEQISRAPEPRRNAERTTKVFTKSVGGKRRLNVEVVKVGDGWTVGHYTACNSLLEAAQRGQRR